jgi:hypothetical protein
VAISFIGGGNRSTTTRRKPDRTDNTNKNNSVFTLYKIIYKEYQIRGNVERLKYYNTSTIHLIHHLKLRVDQNGDYGES